jgi:anti-sigma28 factor (negative regulator of flagellin synthesis)
MGEVGATVMISRTELHGAVQAYLQSLRSGTPHGGGGTQAADQVSIAAGQGDIARWHSMLRSMPELDPAKVQALSQQVDAGTYQPSGEAVAGQIVARWLSDRLPS